MVADDKKKESVGSLSKQTSLSNKSNVTHIPNEKDSFTNNNEGLGKFFMIRDS